eukprot:TRINITY_DN68361_c0_g2_i1.p3 TRINITY_DN68361_c0_g2~~TRINITY_DN68361_c0_g2_i1.p3  ORF type:complete len:111 (-),score=4.85 TRINITY_DN68361_c0_g2_i1:17-349(-)
MERVPLRPDLPGTALVNGAAVAESKLLVACWGNSHRKLVNAFTSYRSQLSAFALGTVQLIDEFRYAKLWCGLDRGLYGLHCLGIKVTDWRAAQASNHRGLVIRKLVDIWR